jgi:hypothetical protein
VPFFFFFLSPGFELATKFPAEAELLSHDTMLEYW